MIIIDNFNQVTAQIETERGISRDVLVSAVEQALISACRKKMRDESRLEADLNPETGEAKIYQLKTVVKKPEDDVLEISLKEAHILQPALAIGDTYRFEVTPDNFGRLAAQAAKQVIIQRIREAEKNVVFKEFKDKIGKIIIGTIQRVENQNYLVNLGRGESILGYKDQIPGERFLAKEKLRVYVVDLDKNAKGSFIQISRSHPGFLRELLIQEIPEIQDGIIDIKSVAREPGIRAKVAVKSKDLSVGAVGACVGHMGIRIQSITKELGREKIDVLEWHDDPKLFIASALKPARVTDVIISNEEDRIAIAVVPNDQLSLAIGKAGVNVRLAVKLTGWRLDVMSEEDFSKEKSASYQPKGQLSIIERIQREKDLLIQQSEGVVVLPQEEDVREEQIKVSDLAKLLGIKTKELVEKAKSFGIDVKSTRSVIGSDIADKIKHQLG